MTDPQATMVETLTGERGHEALKQWIEARLRRPTAAPRASDVPGAGELPPAEALLEEGFAPLGDEIVSFSGDSAQSQALTDRHAGLIVGIVHEVANARPDVSSSFIDAVKLKYSVFDLPRAGQPTTDRQLINWCVQQMALAYARSRWQDLSVALMLFLIPDLSDITVTIRSALEARKQAILGAVGPDEWRQYEGLAEAAIGKGLYPANHSVGELARVFAFEDAVQRTMTEFNFAREAARAIGVHQQYPEERFVRSFNNALYRVSVYLQSRAGEYLQLLQG